MANRDQMLAAVQLCKALIETIREAGPMGAPSGHMYAALMDEISLEQYQQIMAICKSTGLVEERGHCFYYVNKGVSYVGSD